MQNHARYQAIDAFLAAHGWGGAERRPLAGDASFRAYERVKLDGKEAVLMDAPPHKEAIAPFMQVGGQLAAFGLSAPRIFAYDEAQGFILLEDMGDDLFASVLRREPEKERELYLAAAGVLADLYRHGEKVFYPGIAQYDMSRFLPQVNLLTEWFLPLVVGKDAAFAQASRYEAIWRAILAQLPALRPVMVLYDFHAENLLWLPNRAGAQKVGLLDFQDAVAGSPAYDMVSFLEDARRDVSVQTVADVMEFYLDSTGLPREDFMAAYAILGAQRNARIVGTFVRLAQRDSKKHYLEFMPRVWRNLQTDLAHPLLTPLKEWMDDHVPQEWRGVPMLADKRAAG